MKKSFKTLVAATTFSLFLSLPLQQASGISLFSSSSSDARDTPTSVVPEEPEEPVDNRPLSIRLVEAAETHFISQGYTIDPLLTELAQKYADAGYWSWFDQSEASRLLDERGYCSSSRRASYETSGALEQDLSRFQAGTYPDDNNRSYSYAGIALAEGDSSERRTFVIWKAEPCSEEASVVDDEDPMGL